MKLELTYNKGRFREDEKDEIKKNRAELQRKIELNFGNLNLFFPSSQGRFSDFFHWWMRGCGFNTGRYQDDTFKFDTDNENLKFLSCCSFMDHTEEYKILNNNKVTHYLIIISPYQNPNHREDLIKKVYPFLYKSKSLYTKTADSFISIIPAEIITKNKWRYFCLNPLFYSEDTFKWISFKFKDQYTLKYKHDFNVYNKTIEVI